MLAKGFSASFVAVSGKVVEHHDHAWFDLRDQHATYISGKGWSIHSTFYNPWSDKSCLT